jgi:NAD(P) transhydrogenase subunit alpha
MDLIALFYIFALAAFLGLEVISKIPAALHTPLMSGSNAISGITLIGALMATGLDSDAAKIIGFFAIIFATINVVGGYLVTDRMLKFFKK